MAQGGRAFLTDVLILFFPLPLCSYSSSYSPLHTPHPKSRVSGLGWPQLAICMYMHV